MLPNLNTSVMYQITSALKFRNFLYIMYFLPEYFIVFGHFFAVNTAQNFSLLDLFIRATFQGKSLNAYNQ